MNTHRLKLSGWIKKWSWRNSIIHWGLIPVMNWGNWSREWKRWVNRTKSWGILSWRLVSKMMNWRKKRSITPVIWIRQTKRLNFWIATLITWTHKLKLFAVNSILTTTPKITNLKYKLFKKKYSSRRVKFAKVQQHSNTRIRKY